MFGNVIEKREVSIAKAKEIFSSVLIGLLIAFMAWIIIHTLLSAAGLKDGYSYLG